MAFTLELFLVPSNTWVDYTPYLQFGTVTVRRQTLDFTIVDRDASAAQGARISGLWPHVPDSGPIVAITKMDPVDRIGHFFQILSARDPSDMVTGSTGISLSDAPAAMDDPYVLEDGSGNYELEDATWLAAGNYQLEGGTYGYSGLTVRTQTNLDGTTSTYGYLTMLQPGLWPGQTFHLTSTNQGYAATAFVVTEVTITWPANATSPFFYVQFGTNFTFDNSLSLSFGAA